MSMGLNTWSSLFGYSHQVNPSITLLIYSVYKEHVAFFFLRLTTPISHFPMRVNHCLLILILGIFHLDSLCGELFLNQQDRRNEILKRWPYRHLWKQEITNIRPSLDFVPESRRAREITSCTAVARRRNHSVILAHAKIGTTNFAVPHDRGSTENCVDFYSDVEPLTCESLSSLHLTARPNPLVSFASMTDGIHKWGQENTEKMCIAWRLNRWANCRACVAGMP